MTSPFTTTVSGRAISLLDPRAENVHLPDIAHHLGMKPRFGGAILHWYSVAEHCCRVRDLTAVRALKRWPDLPAPRVAGAKLRAQLHDAGEYALGDVLRPVKNAVAVETDILERIEKAQLRAIHSALGFGPDEEWVEIDATIKQADDDMLELEDCVLRNGPVPRWTESMASDPLDCWPWEVAKQRFLETAEQFHKQMHGA